MSYWLIVYLFLKKALYYDPWFDVRIWPNEGATLDQVEENVLKRMDEYLKAYADKFTSSRHSGTIILNITIGGIQ